MKFQPYLFPIWFFDNAVNTFHYHKLIQRAVTSKQCEISKQTSIRLNSIIITWFCRGHVISDDSVRPVPHGELRKSKTLHCARSEIVARETLSNFRTSRHIINTLWIDSARFSRVRNRSLFWKFPKRREVIIVSKFCNDEFVWRRPRSSQLWLVLPLTQSSWWGSRRMHLQRINPAKLEDWILDLVVFRAIKAERLFECFCLMKCKTVIENHIFVILNMQIEWFNFCYAIRNLLHAWLTHRTIFNYISSYA